DGCTRACLGRPRLAEPGEREGALGGRRRCRGGGHVGDLLAVHLEDRGLDGDVVEGGDADDLLPHAGGTGGPGALGPAVADGRNDDDAGVDEVVGGDGRRVLREGGEGRADAHVDDVHAVDERLLHRGGHDVGLGGAVAAEDAVGTELGPGGHTADTAG